MKLRDADLLRTARIARVDVIEAALLSVEHDREAAS